LNGPGKGSISSTCLRTAFMRSDPKSAKETDGLTIFFALLRSLRKKASRKMLAKMIPSLSTYRSPISIREARFVRPINPKGPKFPLPTNNFNEDN